jgi:large subunit ribosomal protein L24e
MAQKCSFCGDVIPQGQGVMFVRNDGRILYYCSMKCDRNSQMGREGKNKKWSKLFVKEAVSSKPSKEKAKKEESKSEEKK